MKIYTKTGDDRQTSLYDGHRVGKDDIRVDTYGTIDELNSFIGYAKNMVTEEKIFDELEKIQRLLFNVAGELATMQPEVFPERIVESNIKELEEFIDFYLEKIGKDKEFRFILPGSNKESASLHVCRSICRRAERKIISLSRDIEVSDNLMIFMNRLSDVLYAFARYLEDVETLIYFKENESIQ